MKAVYVWEVVTLVREFFFFYCGIGFEIKTCFLYFSHYLILLL